MKVHPSLKALYTYFSDEKGEPTLTQLAALLGVSPQIVNNWKRRGVSAEALMKIQAEFGIDSTKLKLGEIQQVSQEVDIHPVTSDGKVTPSNVSELPKGKRVPLISWVQAGDWADIQDHFHPGDADEWFAPVYSKPNGRSYALRVEGESMKNPDPSGLSFPPGTILIVDPDMGWGPGDFVIAKDVLTQQATFKQLTTEAGRWYLKPLNPDGFKRMEIDDPAIRVIGRVCEYMRPGGKL